MSNIKENDTVFTSNGFEYNVEEIILNSDGVTPRLLVCREVIELETYDDCWNEAVGRLIMLGASDVYRKCNNKIDLDMKKAISDMRKKNDDEYNACRQRIQAVDKEFREVEKKLEIAHSELESFMAGHLEKSKFEADEIKLIQHLKQGYRYYVSYSGYVQKLTGKGSIKFHYDDDKKQISVRYGSCSDNINYEKIFKTEEEALACRLDYLIEEHNKYSSSMSYSFKNFLKEYPSYESDERVKEIRKSTFDKELKDHQKKIEDLQKTIKELKGE